MLLLGTFVWMLVCVGAQTVDIRSNGRGKYRGNVRKTSDGIAVHEFFGIPYAQQPVGGLRFKPPRNLFVQSSFTYVFLKPKPVCIQFGNTSFPWYDTDPGESEDCLYLNLWKPANIGDKNRPVKIYVHGGGYFESGSNRMGYYDGFQEAVDTKDEKGNSRKDGILVATINYRLGPLGFLSSGTGHAPGNAGLLDIAFAIDFIYNQLGAFGGDRDKVTVVGQGAGAIAVSLLAANPDLIKASPNLVLNGASFLTLKALPGVDEQGDPYDNNLRLTDVVTKALGCNTTFKENAGATGACIQNANVTELRNVMDSLSPQGPPNVFLPQFKGFKKSPYQALAETPTTARQNISASLTSDEGSYLLTTAYPKVFGLFGENDIPLSESCAKAATRRFLKKFNASVADQLLGKLDRQSTFANRDKVVQALGDAYFNCPMVFFAESMKRLAQPTHFYLLEKRVSPPYNPWAKWMGSVEFNNVQTDFLHKDRKLTVNNQTYDYNDEQYAQAQLTHDLLVSFASQQGQPYDEFTLDNPAYSVLDKDGKLSQEKNTNYHGRNCDILRPFFAYKK